MAAEGLGHRWRARVFRSLLCASATLSVLVVGCRTEPATPRSRDAEGDEQTQVVTWPAWGTVAPRIREPAYIDAQLRRAAGDTALAEAASFADARRDEALWSLARIGGDAAAHRLASALDGGEVTAALAALAALEGPAPGEELSQSQRELEDALWRRYAVEPRARPAEALLLAIARNGSERSLPRLGADLRERPAADASDAGIERYVQGMQALGILCARGFSLDPGTRDTLGAALDKRHPRIERAAIYALGRCARASTELFALAEERRVIASRVERSMDGASDEHRRLGWIALGALGELPEKIDPAILAPDAPLWTVEVEAIRAMVQHETGRALAIDRAAALGIEAFTGPRVHVLIELLSGLRAHAITQKHIDGVVKDWSVSIDERWPKLPVARQRELGHIRCELATLAAIRAGDLDALRACRALALPLDPTPRLEVEALLAMTDAVMDKATRVDKLVARAQDGEPRVAAPALAALAELDDDGVNRVLASALERDDIGVLAAAAGAVAARSRDAGKRSLDVVPALRRVVTRVENGDGIEARLAAIEALGVLARAPERGVKPGTEGTASVEAPWLESVILPLSRDPALAIRQQGRKALEGRAELLARYDRPAPLAGRDAFGEGLESQLTAAREKPVEAVKLHTQLGAITIDLRGARAPINVANFVGLARRGFFDGLRFHRVAPGFVVQGGDPRGDGYGGPGYLVPCEWSNLRYERGTVGIALAGKDTGGSQIFVTQTPQPHLDARYTVIGKVVEGMEVVDRILPGDAIDRVELIERVPATP